MGPDVILWSEPVIDHNLCLTAGAEISGGSGDITSFNRSSRKERANHAAVGGACTDQHGFNHLGTGGTLLF